MESWKDIVLNMDSGITDLDQIPPKKKYSMMGFTISPPKFNYIDIPYMVLIYIYLEPLKYLYEKYDCCVYSEFSKQGRLHFHGYVEFPDDDYGIVYKILNSLEYNYSSALRNCFVLKSNAKENNKYKKYKILRRAQVKPELHLNSRKEWMEYCSKEVEHTKKIIPSYAVIDKREWLKIFTLFISRYNIVD